MMNLLQRYLLPGLVFQGIVIGGGYATGRELVEFFLPSGPIGGLLGMAVAALIWGAVMAISFALSVRIRSYDYKTFFQCILGRFWFLYEILYFVLMILILSVIGAAAGEIARDLIGAPPIFGSLALLAAVGLLAFYGNAVIERFMGAWSILLYMTYFTLVVWCVFAFGDDIGQSFAAAEVGGRWLFDGLRYAGYNLAAVPAVFFCLRHVERQREAAIAGFLAGGMAMLPAVFFYVAMMADYPQIGVASIPSAVLLARLEARWFEVLFQIVLLGTFVQTGLGLVHTVNERIAASFAERGRMMPPALRPVIALGLLTLALTLAAGVGIVGLIAQGYGLLTYGFIAVFVIPVMTVGLWKTIPGMERTQ